MAKKNKYKILTIVGARPQFIKAAALSRAFCKNGHFEEIIVHSGQHYDNNLSQDFFDELDIPNPSYNLEIGSKPHNVMIGEFLIKFDPIIEKENPDLIIVYGDTNTTAAGAIAAAKRYIPLAHVEAGLREFNKSIPEEVNKLITDSITDLFFTPTNEGVKNLAASGVTQNVHLTGDISLDLLFNSNNYLSIEELQKEFLIQDKFAILTCHRDANTTNKNNLINILKAVSTLDIQVVFPIHPRTKAAIEHHKLHAFLGENVLMISPLPFWTTQSLIKNSEFVITDSGGIIKEAYFHKVPGIIIDKQTEWVETIEEGWNRIAGPNLEKITDFAKNMNRPKIHTQALGDGKAGERIANIIYEYLNS